MENHGKHQGAFEDLKGSVLTDKRELLEILEQLPVDSAILTRLYTWLIETGYIH